MCVQLPTLTSLQFQALRDCFQTETGEPLTVHTLADAKHVPNVASALCAATRKVISHQDVWELQRAAFDRVAKLHPEKQAADLAHRAAAKMNTPREGVLLPDTASLDLERATSETIMSFIRGALNAKADNISDIACSLRTRIAREFSSDFKQSLEINQCIAEALLVLYHEFPQFAWLNEVIFFADAGHAQRMLDREQKVEFPDDWKKIQDPFWRARCEWLTWFSEDSGDMPTAWLAEKRALSARNVTIDLFFGDQQGEEAVRQETQKARSVVIQNLHEAVTFYTKAGNLPAARRCLYLLARYDNRGLRILREN